MCDTTDSNLKLSASHQTPQGLIATVHCVRAQVVGLLPLTSSSLSLAHSLVASLSTSYVKLLINPYFPGMKMMIEQKGEVMQNGPAKEVHVSVVWHQSLETLVVVCEPRIY